LPTIVGAVIYVGFVLTVVRKFLQRLAKHYHRTGRLTQVMLAGIYLGVVISALITETIGIHLIFGAFLLGAVMPKNAELTRELAEKTEDFVLVFLLPIFFAYSGLKTQIGLLNTPQLWLLCLSILAVAVAGKYFGAYIAARFCGVDNREASALGWLMNTRGLTELIVLNIGLSLGVISPVLFTMLVMMALVTTFMTSPLLELAFPKRLMQLDVVEQAEPTFEPNYRIIVSVANPNSQRGLLELGIEIAGTNQSSAVVHPLSLIEIDEQYAFESTPTETQRLIEERKENLEELIETLEPPRVRKLVQPIVTVTNDVARETAQIAEIDKADLIIVGWHRPTFTNNRLGGRVGQILSIAPVDVAVFVERGKDKFNQLLVPYAASIHDDLALEIALRMLINDDSRQLTLLQVLTEPQQERELSYEVRNALESLPQEVRSHIEHQMVESSEPLQVAVSASIDADLTIVGTNREWGLERQTLGRYTDELAVQCHSSLLITRCHLKTRSHLASIL
jgi:nucleotide-binding universal stress UspA family protein